MSAIRLRRHASRAALALSLMASSVIGMTALTTVSAMSEDAATSADATYQDIEKTIGSVPAFVKAFPKAALPGAWEELKAVEFSDQTALPPKVKALIGIAVAAQIPCDYCVWADTQTARQFGATDEEIAEAVTVAALSRHWSTFFHGMQVDFETFKKELGGEPAAK